MVLCIVASRAQARTRRVCALDLFIVGLDVVFHTGIGQIANVSTLSIGLREFDDSGVFLYLFYVNCEAGRLGPVLRSLTAGDSQQSVAASLTRQGVSFDHLIVGNSFSVTALSDPYWCYDAIRNQDETDVDCGGDTCSRRCVLGGRCLWDGDCQRGTCVDGECALSTGLNGWSIVPVAVFVVVVVLAIGIVLWGQKQLKEARKKELPIVNEQPSVRISNSTYPSRSTSVANATESGDTFPDDQTTITASETELEREMKEKARVERAFTRKHKAVATDVSLKRESIHHALSSDTRRHSKSLGEMGIPQRLPVALFRSHNHLVNDSN